MSVWQTNVADSIITVLIYFTDLFLLFTKSMWLQALESVHCTYLHFVHLLHKQVLVVSSRIVRVASYRAQGTNEQIVSSI
jgi:hypothetical protein